MEASPAPCGVAFTDKHETQAAAAPGPVEGMDGWRLGWAEAPDSFGYVRIPTIRAKPMKLMVGAAGFEPTTP